MPRAIWSGAIAFGLVNVPVKVFSAVSHKDVRFHQFEEGTGSRIRYKKVSEASGEEVPNENIVKGYEVARGRHVTVMPEEIDAVKPESSRTIEIEQFVDLHEIDPIFYDNTYYLAPGSDRGGSPKAYQLLLRALEDKNKVGIGRVVMREKEYLAALRPFDGALAMSTMLFADEVVDVHDIEQLPVEGDEVSDRELDMAGQVIDSLTDEWDPDRFEDTYRQQVLDLVRRKEKGEDVVTEEAAEEPSAPVIDLLGALERSVDAAKKGGTKARQLEQLTVDELGDLAREAGIRGRSTMSKAELVEALSGRRKSA